MTMTTTQDTLTTATNGSVQAEDLPELTAETPQTNGTTPEAPDPTEGWFEISADVKAVRGKSTSDGPALEIVLDASIDGHVADLMGLIGKSLTRIRFKPYVYQQPLPMPTVEAEEESLNNVLRDSDDWDGSVTKTEITKKLA